MPKLKTLSIVPPALYLYDMLGQVKQYASVADESRDAMLTALVQAAALIIIESLRKNRHVCCRYSTVSIFHASSASCR